MDADEIFAARKNMIQCNAITEPFAIRTSASLRVTLSDCFRQTAITPSAAAARAVR